MSGLDELKQRVEAFLAHDHYVDPAADLSAPHTDQDFHYRTLLAWQELRSEASDVLLPFMMRDPNPSQVLYSNTPEKDMGVGSYILDVENARYYELQRNSDGGYTLADVDDRTVGLIQENSSELKGKKLLLLADNERFVIDDGSQEIFRFSHDAQTGAPEIAAVEPVHYDPEQRKAFVAAFRVEGENGEIQQYHLMHKADGGQIAIPRKDYLELVRQNPDLGGARAWVTDEPLSLEELGRLPEIGIEVRVADANELASEQIVAPVVERELDVPEVDETVILQPVEHVPLSDVVVQRTNGDVVQLPEGEEPREGDRVIEVADDPVVEQTPIMELVANSTGAKLPLPLDMEQQRIPSENQLYEGARNIFFSLQSDGVFSKEALQRFDEVVAVFAELEGEGGVYGALLKEARDIMFDESGEYTQPDIDDWSRLAEMQQELDQSFAARINAVVNPNADIKTAPVVDAAPLPEPGR